MGTFSPRPVPWVVGGLSAAGVAAAHFADGGTLLRTLEFAGLLLTAILAAALGPCRNDETDAGAVPAFFVPAFAALLLFSAGFAALVAAAGALTPRAGGSADRRAGQLLAAAAGSTIASLAAAMLYAALGGTPGLFAWPWHGARVAAAAAAYCLAGAAVSQVLVPLVSRRRVDPSWARRTAAGFPVFLVAAGLAAGCASIVDQRAWTLLPVAAVPVYFAWRVYEDYLRRLDEARRHRAVAGFMEEGFCILGGDGRITLWSDPLERILGCPRARALGQSVVGAVPALGGTELPRTIKDTLSDRAARTVEAVRVPLADEARMLRVRLVPVAEGLSLFWSDVSGRVRTEQELRRAGERFALAAEGANDGLWEWDLRSGQFHGSRRWWEMLGLPAVSEGARPEAWLDRVHPEDLAALRQAIDAHLAGESAVLHVQHRLLHEDGTWRRFLCRGVASNGAGRRRDRMAGSLTDTTEQTIAEERLRRVGFLDSLTGLCNREVFVEGLGRRLEETRGRRVSSCFAVLYLDIDRFKIVNDSLGHLVGDELLVGISRRLESCLRSGDALARLGGDEFAILLGGLVDDGQANAIAFRIQEALGQPFSIAGREVFTSASIGIAFGPAHYTNPDEVMRDADTAMYHAKSRGKARHEVYDAVMHARMRDRLSLENDLRRAVGNRDFEVHYQPIVALTTGMCVGFESLVRWTRNGEPVSPATFIPIAEELGLVEHIGTWVLQQACAAFADWQRRFPQAGLECITVNVSSRQLMQHNFLRIVQQAVQDSGVQRADLRVEITETALMDNPGEAAELLRDLRNYGVKVYLDDFGTGYSSLSHLHKLPVDALKIDRSFVKSLLLPDRPAIVESILALARTLNTSVVAEGIERDEQARELERLGCTHAQGFLFSRPLSAAAVEALLTANLPLGPKGSPAPAPQVGYWPDTVPVPAAVHGAGAAARQAPEAARASSLLVS